jgi:hypothetical protein
VSRGVASDVKLPILPDSGLLSFYFAYNFIKIHRTLRTSPAMAAGVTDRLSSVEDLVALWEAYEQRRAERAG